ncbi:M24/M37 family peptidase [Alcanivorax hongdengensis A-11-3]|uniref:M24/M37 family peptidase n=1 Tax=Alcanivorax hongdengensis A-11-3 TaxID=1177179 RepID=L0WBB2_9GAMM|nr:M23 family metallopeptidase [Alcanivorax hongdengensis]EKF74256.1 M24/M37 family peptidase [Alcanivorax hongdengensis A-11-3]
MNIIVLNSQRGHSRTIPVPRYWPWLLAAVLFVIPVLVGGGAYWLSYQVGKSGYTPLVTERFADQLAEQKQQVQALNRQSQEEFRAMTLKLAQAQARLMRLDALGERLVDVADIGSDEFDFNSDPGLGGPDVPGDSVSFAPPSFMDALNDMTATLERRERQLDILDDLLSDQELKKQTYLSGRPVKKGWMSSRFGRRADPFSGKIAFHRGMDFAAKMGTPIIATGSGVVTYAGPRSGYGELVQINHGGGLATRYGHAEKILVKPGDIVRTGDVIALVGNEGRSTGPHVHYEVLKNGRQINPQPYIYRARR